MKREETKKGLLIEKIKKNKTPHEQMIYVGGRNYLKSHYTEEKYKEQKAKGKEVCWIRKNLD